MECGLNGPTVIFALSFMAFGSAITAAALHSWRKKDPAGYDETAAALKKTGDKAADKLRDAVRRDD